MEKDPLLPYISTRPPPVLCPLPEHDEISLPPPLTPSELKDRLIFGSPADQSPSLYDDFAVNFNSPNFTNPNFTNPSFTNPNFTNPSCSNDHNPEQQPSWLSDPKLGFVKLGPNLTNPNLTTSTSCSTDQQFSWLSDPSYGFQRNSLHRSKTAPAMAAINDLCHHPSVGKPPKLISSTIIPQACVLLVIYLMFGVAIYWFNTEDFRATETHPVVDALYFCIVTMCTIGYGDITPNSTTTKLFSIMFVLVGFGFIDILLSGMVTYVLDLQESYLLKTNANVGGNREKARKSYIIDVKKGRMRIRLKVALALGVVVICIGIGAAVMHFLEDLPWLDSFYLSVMSVTTVGYGDKAFTSMTGRLFASIWLLVSTLAVARAFLYLAEARVDKRHRIMAKWVLGQDMTVSQFLAADIDNNGFVTKSEYVIYKLKEMGKITDKDVLQICRKFEQIDAGNCGKITLADLMGSHL